MSTIDAFSKIAAGLSDPVVIAPAAPAADLTPIILALLAAIAACVIFCGKSDSGPDGPLLFDPPKINTPPELPPEIPPAIPLDNSAIYLAAGLLLIAAFHRHRKG